jgi:hypothetical protein
MWQDNTMCYKVFHVEGISSLKFISSCFQLLKGILLLYPNSLYTHISQKSFIILEEMGQEVLQHPLCSSYFVLSDLHHSSRT